MSTAPIPAWGDWQDWGEDCEACARHHQQDFLRARLARRPDFAAAAAEEAGSLTSSPLSLGSPALRFSPWGSRSAEGHEGAASDGGLAEGPPGWTLRQRELAGALQASLQRSLRRGLSRVGHLPTRWAGPRPHLARWEGPGETEAGGEPRSASGSGAPWVWGQQQGQSPCAGEEGTDSDLCGKGPRPEPTEQQQQEQQNTAGWTVAPECGRPGVHQKQGFLHLPAWTRGGALGLLAPTSSLFGGHCSAKKPLQGASVPGAADNICGKATEKPAQEAEGGGQGVKDTLLGGEGEQDDLDMDSCADNASRSSDPGSIRGSDAALSESEVALGCTLFHSPDTGSPDSCSLTGSHHSTGPLPSPHVPDTNTSSVVLDTSTAPVESLEGAGDEVISKCPLQASAQGTPVLWYGRVGGSEGNGPVRMGLPVPRPQTAPMGCFKRLPAVTWPLQARSPLRSMEEEDPSSGALHDVPGPRVRLPGLSSAGPVHGFSSSLARLPGKLLLKKGAS